MGRILKPLALVGAAIFTGGVLAPALVAAGGFAAVGVASALTSIAGIAAVGGAIGVLNGAVSYLGGSGRGGGLAPFDPRQINPDPAAPRKAVLGRTAMPLDLRYAEPSGSNQEYVDYVFALAAHKSAAVESIYIEDDLAWTVGGGAQGKFAGYLTIEVILEAGSGAFHTVNAGTKWGSSQRLTGCTTMKVRVKRSDNSKSSQSPFASGISGRWTVIGKGMPVYDPALDSTVPGGSGTQRANDCTTWAYTAGIERGNNPALQLLAYLLGWKINGIVSVGAGLPADAIDLASFATAAARCDESVALAAGGSQRRYESGVAFTDADDPLAVVETLLAAMNAELSDDTGRLALRVAVNDLTPALTLTDDDFVGGYEWRPVPPVSEQFTVVRARYSQPDAPSLFGIVDAPEVAIPRTSLAPRALSLDLRAVQDQRRAERIAKQVAQTQLYRGEFSVTLGIRGWQVRRNMVVAITSNVRGWTAKLFRARSITFNLDGTVNVLFREENAARFAWDASESAVVTPVAPVVFDSRAAASWLMADIAAGSTRNVPRGTYDAGTTYTRGDSVIFSGSTYTLIVDSSTGNAPPDAARWVLSAAAGSGPAGADGIEGITVSATNQAHNVPTEADGSGGDYSTAGGTMILRRGTTVLSPTFSIAATSPAGSWITINSSTGVYTVGNPGATLGTATLRANVGGVNYDLTYTIAKTLKGVAGPNLTLVADAQAFTFTDGAANPGSQTITLNALLTNLSGTATWATTPSVTLGGSGNTRTLALADFGANRQVTVEATKDGITDRITIVRLERNITAPNAANRVPFSRFERGMADWPISLNSGSVSATPFAGEVEGRRVGTYNIGFNAAGQNFAFRSLAFPVLENRRLSIQGRLGIENIISVASWAYFVLYFDQAGTFMASQTIASGTTLPAWRDPPVQAFLQIPGGARTAYVQFNVDSAAPGAALALLAEPHVTTAAPDQTAHPAFTPGPNAQDGADITGLNTSFDTARVNGVAAATLVADAAAAKADSASALSQISAITADSVLDKSEKPAVIQQWQTLNNERGTINARADAFGITTEKTNYNNANSALDSYLGGLSPGWDDLATDTPIVRSTFNGKFTDVYFARQALLDKIAEVASQRANLMPANGNLVPYSGFEGGIAFWPIIFTDAGGGYTTFFAEVEGRRVGVYTPTFTAAGQGLDWRSSTFPVQGGARLSAQVRPGIEGVGSVAGWSVALAYFDQSGSFISFGVIAQDGPLPAWRDPPRQAFLDVPSTARTAYLKMYVQASGAGSPLMVMAQPFITYAVAGQTVHPPYVPGNAGDVTADALVTLRRGDWQSGVVYLRGQSVVRNRSSYVALVNHTSDAGNGPPGANWGVVADGGVDGAPGATGPTGATGPQGIPGVDGVDGIDGTDGKLVEFVWRRAATIPATPTGNGIPAGWSDNPPAGSDPLWMSKGKQELDGTLIGAWSTPVRHDGPPGATGATGPTGPTGATGPQGPTGVSAPPIKALTTGAAQFDPIRLENGQTLTVDAELFLNTGGSAGACTLQVQWSIHDANSWTTMSGGSASDTQPTSEPVELTIAGATYTNSTGVAQLFDFRSTSVRQGRTVNAPPSFMRVI